jgi:hypothetical protein
VSSEFERIIDAMCVTWRHDFGLVLPDNAQWYGSGMTERERERLRSQMRQLWEHNIAPLLPPLPEPPADAEVAQAERAVIEAAMGWRQGLSQAGLKEASLVIKAADALRQRSTAAKEQG